MYTPFVPQFYKMTTLDPRPHSSTRSTQELCDSAAGAQVTAARPQAHPGRRPQAQEECPIRARTTPDQAQEERPIQAD